MRFMPLKIYPNYYACSIKGFTLAELLIALAILGVIATFTIPKVLQVQENFRYKATAKEAMASIEGAFEVYRQKNTVNAGTAPIDLLPYLNYVKYDTSSSIDDEYGYATPVSCGTASSGGCLRMHGGGMLLLTQCGLNGTGSTNAMYFMFDPDGKPDSSATGPAESIYFVVYSNGRLTTFGTIMPNTYSDCGGPVNPPAGTDPPWFSWN